MTTNNIIPSIVFKLSFEGVASKVSWGLSVGGVLYKISVILAQCVLMAYVLDHLFNTCTHAKIFYPLNEGNKSNFKTKTTSANWALF